MYKKILVEGEGEEDDTPPTGAKVTVHYTGVLQATGQIFDSSRFANPNTRTRLPLAVFGPFALGFVMERRLQMRAEMQPRVAATSV